MQLKFKSIFYTILFVLAALLVPIEELASSASEPALSTQLGIPKMNLRDDEGRVEKDRDGLFQKK